MTVNTRLIIAGIVFIGILIIVFNADKATPTATPTPIINVPQPPASPTQTQAYVSPQLPPATTTTPTDTQTADASIQIGDEGYLDNNLDTVLVAHTQEADGKITDATIAKDTVGIEKMIDTGDAFFVDKGTKVKLIGYGDGIIGANTYHVRFEDGSHADDDGWIPMEFMKK